MSGGKREKGASGEASLDRNSFELYLHIPFCVRKCNYCDFLSGPATPLQMREYTDALIREIEASEEDVSGTVSSVFIGGGTPSLLENREMEQIFEQLNKKFHLAPDAEITIEANPGTLSMEKLQVFKALGVNRLSLGLQSADDRELQMLGRIHTFEQFEKNYRDARKAGFDNINVDLMMALPDSTRESWEKTLRTTAELGPEHISAYSLILEEGTPFYSMNLNLPEEETEYAMYEDTVRILEEYGYHPYEISNYALEGRECRHNCGYWERKDYLGFGVGAASLWKNSRFSNTRRMETYLKYSGCPENIREEKEILSREDRMAERMFLGLRMRRGVSEEEFLREFGVPMEQVYKEVLEKYTEMKLLERKDGRVFLTEAGIHVSNRVMADFLIE